MHCKDFYDTTSKAGSHTHLEIHKSPNKMQKIGRASPTWAGWRFSIWRRSEGPVVKLDDGSGADDADPSPQ